MIWYLILNFAHGGALAIPEPNEQVCQAMIKRLDAQKSFFSDAHEAYCLPGLQSGVLQ